MIFLNIYFSKESKNPITLIITLHKLEKMWEHVLKLPYISLVLRGYVNHGNLKNY